MFLTKTQLEFSLQRSLLYNTAVFSSFNICWEGTFLRFLSQPQSYFRKKKDHQFFWLEVKKIPQIRTWTIYCSFVETALRIPGTSKSHHLSGLICAFTVKRWEYYKRLSLTKNWLIPIYMSDILVIFLGLPLITANHYIHTSVFHHISWSYYVSTGIYLKFTSLLTNSSKDSLLFIF